MLKRKNGQIGILSVSLAVVFTIGLILGTIALFYMPESSVYEAAEAFVLNENKSFGSLFEENITFELLWMLLLWIMGSSAVTAPFMGAVMSLRGFVIGFSVSFVFTGEFDRARLFLCSILPQCITALPVMSMFVITCVLYSSDRKYNANYQYAHFMRGILFVLLTFVASIAETWFMLIFEKFC